MISGGYNRIIMDEQQQQQHKKVCVVIHAESLLMDVVKPNDLLFLKRYFDGFLRSFIYTKHRIFGERKEKSVMLFFPGFNYVIEQLRILRKAGKIHKVVLVSSMDFTLLVPPVMFLQGLFQYHFDHIYDKYVTSGINSIDELRLQTGGEDMTYIILGKTLFPDDLDTTRYKLDLNAKTIIRMLLRHYSEDDVCQVFLTEVRSLVEWLRWSTQEILIE